MSENIIFTNEFLKFFCFPDGVYIEIYKKGFPFDQLTKILLSHPEIDINNINVLRNVLNTAPHPAEKIGTLKEKIVMELVDNGLRAYVIYNLPKEELEIQNRERLMQLTNSKLSEKGINFGVNKALFSEEIHSGKSYLIAQGIPPIDGTDSVIKMYELENSAPEVHEDGKVDFYELKLINRVKVGDWLGERIDATDGKPGLSVLGTPIKPTNGKTFPLCYDKNSVMEKSENQKTTLYSRVNGAVNYSDGKIAICSHLEIDGDVDFKTGNINFDGYITIKGTVTDGFLVRATKDIEINSQLGLGNVKGIISTQGSIFIKGGVASKGGVEIKAENNVFTKFVDNCTITCGGTAHIGFYIINSTINAAEVVVESSNGKIIGGSVSAHIRVICPIIGSEMEKKTTIEVRGFNRTAYKDELDAVFHKLSELKNEQQKLKISMSRFEGLVELNPIQRKEYNEGFERTISIKAEIKQSEQKRKDIAEFLKTKGDGEIRITKKIYPNCSLHLNGHKVDITSETNAISYYVQNGELKQIT